MRKILIIGGKPSNINYKNIGKKYDVICRVNLNLKNKSPNDKDIFFVNQHINDFMVKKRLSPEKLKKYPYDFIDLNVLKDYHDMLNNNEYGQIIEQYESGSCLKSNEILKKLGCPLKFIKAPRCGYQAILFFIVNGFNVDVCGFSFKNEENITYYTGGRKVSTCHDTKNELIILHWLHENNKINATLCMLENFKLPCLNCENREPGENEILYFLKYHGICILKNFYNKEMIDTFIKEHDRVFDENKNKIEILDKEGCSNDERIFHTERYSTYIKNNFSDVPLFNNIARKYRNHLNKKTLINKLIYEEGKVKNSGAGWHRDNHDCQFKTIMYLSDVKSENGPFTWITNSSKHHIGYPEPRTKSYNTRFHDKTIEKLLNENKKCENIEVCGSVGDIILANTTYIHRGKVIEGGIRKAMTEYFF